MRPLMSVRSNIHNLDWGKAGWLRCNGCFRGSIAYPDTWCSYDCALEVRSSLALKEDIDPLSCEAWLKHERPAYACLFELYVTQLLATVMQALDPAGKFSGSSDVWSFNAADTSTHASVPFSSCCTAQVESHHGHVEQGNMCMESLVLQ